MNENQSKPAPLSWFTQSTFKYTPYLIELAIIAVVLRLLGLVQPFVFQAIIDRVLPFQREATLSLIVAILIATTVFSATLSALAAYLGTHMGNRLVTELARRIYSHVLELPLRFLQRWPVGETLARIGEIDTVRAFLTGTVMGIALDALFAVIYLAAMLAISPLLTMIVLITLPLEIATFSAMGPFIRRRMQEAFLAGSRHQARLVEAFGNDTTVKALASEQLQVERFQETLRDSIAKGFRVTKLNILNGFMGDILGGASNIITIYVGCLLVFRNEITLGQLIAFNMLAGNVSGPIMSLSSLWEQWQGLKIARLRLGDFLNVDTETKTDKPPLKIEGPLTLRFNGVSFGYSADHPVIQDLSAIIKPGHPTLIIGNSGCGKSTLAKLASGLYAPDNGQIDANGDNLSDRDARSIRQAIAYLPQEAALFSGSIRDNLLMAKPNATDIEIERALADSASTAFVASLPNGIHTDVGEAGGHLSGGQRQRIALARALLHDPSALVLDEPTSSLDEGSVDLIVATLRRLAKEKTLIVITHNRNLFGKDTINLIDLNHPERYRGRS